LQSAEKACLGLTHGIHDQRAIQKQISGFATRFRNQKTSMAGRAVQRPIIVSGSGSARNF
jgi:hypothetical protein